MVRDNVFGFHSAVKTGTPAHSLLARTLTALSGQCARLWCGMHGHLILLHFEPNKLSLQCALCGYESEGWEVGRPQGARRQADSHAQAYARRTDRRHALHAVPPDARMAS